MPFVDRFQQSDELVQHLNGVVPGLTDPILLASYSGFLSVAAVTVYELAVKDIFFEFSGKKHKVLSSFVKNTFERMNGRIKTDDLTKSHISRFGDKYIKRFKKILRKREVELLRRDRVNITANYNNIITWRHSFAHQGVLPAFVSYSDVHLAYQSGKEVISCLGQTMRY